MDKTYKFILPQNKEVKSTNVRIENGEVFVDVEFKEKFEPKDGDFVISETGLIFIFGEEETISEKRCAKGYVGVAKEGNMIYQGLTYSLEKARFATPEEKSAFLARLEKECGKRWNAEKKCLEDIRWRAEEGNQYWFVSTISVDISPKLECNAPFDNERYDSGNYFRTPEAAQKVADQIKEIFKSSKAE